MGISWQGDNLTVSMQKAGKALEGKIKKDAYDILPTMMDMGIAEMQYKIEHVKSAIVGKDDRVDTGSMFLDVTGTTVKEEKKGVYSIEYGWPFGVQPYYLVQEHGGYTDEVYMWRGEEGYISPMHALFGAHIYTSQEFIREAIRRWG